eukprot:SAG11_NODE_291_length_11180_cov_102.040155_4_plen_192_part_00
MVDEVFAAFYRSATAGHEYVKDCARRQRRHLLPGALRLLSQPAPELCGLEGSPDFRSGITVPPRLRMQRGAHRSSPLYRVVRTHAISVDPPCQRCNHICIRRVWPKVAAWRDEPRSYQRLLKLKNITAAANEPGGGEWPELQGRLWCVAVASVEGSGRAGSCGWGGGCQGATACAVLCCAVSPPTSYLWPQ